jgi:hypothetical protein
MISVWVMKSPRFSFSKKAMAARYCMGMADIVNQTWEAAARWQREVVWMRMNAGYINAELPYLRGHGVEVGDIEQLARDFEPAFALFCEREMDVFVAARSVEAGLASRDDFAAKLRALADCFQPWLEKLHAAVQARRAADDRGLGLGLLHGCGSELFNAQRRFADAVETYAATDFA